jgi:hypothetical protein
VSGAALSAERWQTLESYRNEFTCYSAAIATWLAPRDDDWAKRVNTGLCLTLTEAGDGLLGFAYFPAGLRAELGLVRRGADESDDAVQGVLSEIDRSGAVIVAGDGFQLPWHVAAGRVHAPHWFVLTEGTDGLEVADPFACRNELGVQSATRRSVSLESLEALLLALPGHDPVHRLRERLALGDESSENGNRRHQWFVRGEVRRTRKPEGAEGADGVERLARHFREQGQNELAYAQADDIWSIARHRAFMCRHAGERAARAQDGELAAWVSGYATPLAKKWGHIAPLLMQATLALRAGRPASSSVPDTLEQLAQLERAAAAACPEGSFTI